MPLKKQYQASLREISEILAETNEEYESLKHDKDFMEFEKFARLRGYCPPDRYTTSLQDLRKGWMSSVKLYKILLNAERHGYNKETFYSLNSHGLRSDEFKKKHSGKHILFAGCSVTFGEGLPLEKTWSKKVYDKISSLEKTSGYFNVAVPGLTTIESIYQIQNYIKKFGTPDIIFFNMPDFEREIQKDFIDRNLNDPTKTELLLKLIYGSYDIFRKYCLKNKIKLFSFTWDHPDATYWDYPFDITTDLEDFYLYSPEDRSKYIYQYGIDNPIDQKSGLYAAALDGEHPGFAVNEFYSNFMYDKYMSWRNNDKQN
jgi:hypothetical protein